MPQKQAAAEAERFHRYFDDYRFIKIFAYLTEVGDQSGPHAYIKKSHIGDRLNKQKRYSEEEV